MGHHQALVKAINHETPPEAIQCVVNPLNSAGAIGYFDENLDSPHKLPKDFDHSLFIYEWSRNWVINVKLDENDNITQMERFCPKMTFKRPMDMELGPDGCLYIIEWGTAWGKNQDSQIVRIEHQPGIQESFGK